MDLRWLTKIEYDDLYEHIFAVNVEHRPPEQQHLGYVDKSQDALRISLPKSGLDLEIQQSVSSLSSAVQSSSTGFICWQTATKFADWVLSDEQGPVMALIRGAKVLEMGAGTAAVLVSTLGTSAGHYVASDQKHLLKLMKANFVENVTKKFSSSTCEGTREGRGKERNERKDPTVDFIEFDWEDPEEGIHAYRELSGASPDVILACDTIYNEFLIPHFLCAMKKAMSSATIAVVAMQLREESILETFLETAFTEELLVYAVPDTLLSHDLIQGFAVYCFKSNESS